MITNNDIIQMIKSDLVIKDSMVSVALLELLELREQLRPRKPDEKPEQIYDQVGETLLIDDGHNTYVGGYNYDTNTFWTEDYGILDDVVAWMPLPSLRIDHEND